MKTTYLPPIHPGTTQNQLGEDSTTQSRAPPIKYGIIMDWETMENLWSHLFYCGLKVSPKELPVLMSDSPTCPTTSREKTAEVLFESFGVPALHTANTGFLSLCSCGRITGLAIDAGAGVSHVTPIYSGETWMKGTYRLDVAGRILSKYMHNLLLNSSNHPQLIGTLAKKTVARIKKQHCYVSKDYEKDLQDQTCPYRVNFKTPDGHWMTLDKERFRCPEPLFRPHLLNQSSPGLHVFAFQSLQTLPEEYKEVVLNNVVLSGGSSMFPGFSERMFLELDALFRGRGHQISILAVPQRCSAAWMGGSLATSLSSFQQFWMRKEDYQEHGAAYVHKKFK